MMIRLKTRNVEEDVCFLPDGEQHHAHSRLAGFSTELFVQELTANFIISSISKLICYVFLHNILNYSTAALIIHSSVFICILMVKNC